MFGNKLFLRLPVEMGLRPISWVFFASIVVLLFLLFWPLPDALKSPQQGISTHILDRHGTLLYESRDAHGGSKSPIPIGDMPQSLLDAVVAIEDRMFFSHFGISIRGIVRAFSENQQAGRIVSGGSTITQQLVRNLLKPKKRDYLWKIEEAYFAVRLEMRMSKREILEAYLNIAPFGHEAYGISSAAQIYFAKSPRELSIAESALLAGLLQSPVSLNPYRNMSGAKERQKKVLAAELEMGKISKEQYESALAEAISLTRGKIEMKAPHFVQWVLGKMTNDKDEMVEGRGAGEKTMETTLDYPLQQEVERIVANHLEKLKEKNVSSAAVVVLDAHTGEILSMIGSADYWDEKHDGAVNIATSLRQPGSALKPFTYALALEKGDTVATTVADIETQFFTQDGNPYTPRNYDYGYHGLVRYREALANSYNIAAVKVLEKVGVGNLLNLLRQLGITSLNQSAEHYGLALTLGDAEVSLLELTKAYGVFASGGKTVETRFIASQTPGKGEQIISPQIAYLITSILSDNSARMAEFGDDSPLAFSFPVAAKTGTTRNSRDNWTIGYTPDRIVGVWVGNADNSPMRETSGITGAGPIFHDVMLAATQNLPKKSFSRPSGIVEREICRLSGKLPTKLCSQRMEEIFVSGTEPKEQDTMYQEMAIDTRNGLRAGSGCSPAFVRNEVFTVYPQELQQWARENGVKQVPKAYSPLCPLAQTSRQGGSVSAQEQNLFITKPSDGESFLLDPLIPKTSQKIIFSAEGSRNIDSVEWLVDGKVVGEGKSPDFRFEWLPSIGKHSIFVKSGMRSDAVKIEILKKE